MKLLPSVLYSISKWLKFFSIAVLQFSTTSGLLYFASKFKSFTGNGEAAKKFIVTVAVFEFRGLKPPSFNL